MINLKLTPSLALKGKVDEATEAALMGAVAVKDDVNGDLRGGDVAGAHSAGGARRVGGGVRMRPVRCDRRASAVRSG